MQCPIDGGEKRLTGGGVLHDGIGDDGRINVLAIGRFDAAAYGGVARH